MYIVNGVIFGLILSVLVGPVFFTLLQTSIEYSFRKAVLVALGINLSDVFYIALAYFGLAKALEKSGAQEYLGYGGGIILLLFGLVSIFKKTKISRAATIAGPGAGFFRFLFKGFLVNGLSPFVLVFWLGTMSLATIEYAYSGYQLLFFFTSVLLVVFGTDCLKAYLANKLKSIITTRLMRVINVCVGLVLIGFGLRMFFYSW